MYGDVCVSTVLVTIMKIALKILVNKNDHKYGASAAEQILSYLPYNYNKYTDQ